MNTKHDRGLQVVGPSKDFESIKKLDENGVEYWEARELMKVLGYMEWRTFSDVIDRAMLSAQNSDQNIDYHFGKLTNMVKTGSGAVRPVNDWKLDRYACYLIAQNGDSDKPAIALAQTYFAVQTRRQEIADDFPNQEKRISMRDEVSDKNKILFSTARLSGVSNFGLFNDAGYKGLYGMPSREIEQKKGIPKGELLDRAGSVELGANLFRITQTEDKLRIENIKGDFDSRKTHFDVGKKIRQTMRELGTTMPEDLKPEIHIKEIRKRIAKPKKSLK